jgi:hypothetical protein
MHVQMRQFIRVGAVVDFSGIEGGLHRLGGAGDVLGEEREFGRRQLEELVDVRAVSDDAAAAVRLLFEEIKRGDLHRPDLDHEILEALIFAAIEAVGEFGHG